MTLNDSVEVLKALAHPLRLRISLGLSKKKECNVNTMVETLGVPQATVSNQLTILRKAGIVSNERKGTTVCYSIEDEGIKRLLSVIETELALNSDNNASGKEE